jgi:hypothetical protein
MSVRGWFYARVFFGTLRFAHGIDMLAGFQELAVARVGSLFIRVHESYQGFFGANPISRGNVEAQDLE